MQSFPSIIPGINTSVMVNGNPIHIQTEDKGIHRHQIETLIFFEGQILDVLKTDYSDRFEENVDLDISRLLHKQHLQTVLNVKKGKYRDFVGARPPRAEGSQALSQSVKTSTRRSKQAQFQNSTHAESHSIAHDSVKPTDRQMTVPDGTRDLVNLVLATFSELKGCVSASIFGADGSLIQREHFIKSEHTSRPTNQSVYDDQITRLYMKLQKSAESTGLGAVPFFQLQGSHLIIFCSTITTESSDFILQVHMAADSNTGLLKHHLDIAATLLQQRDDCLCQFLHR